MIKHLACLNSLVKQKQKKRNKCATYIKIWCQMLADIVKTGIHKLNFQYVRTNIFQTVVSVKQTLE